MLSKKLSTVQWGSLVCLFVGVALVQVQELSSSSSSSASAQKQYPALGLLAVIISCLSSGFAGVYVEKMLKQSKASLWLRNVQLGMFGALTGFIGVLAKDLNVVASQGVFHGYTWLVWTVIVQQALGGLIVAVVVKYADNILKGFSTSLSIIISCVVSVFIFQYVISLPFIIGALLVILAIYLYGKFPPPIVVNPSENRL